MPIPSRSLVVIICASLLLAACFGGGDKRPKATSKPPKDNVLPVGDQGGTEKVGSPYKIAGKWYYPREDPAYDQTGLASWYGKQFHGRPTANGETFNMNALTAAHKTLPMPSFVKVTNLRNGRSLVLRVNDRGPFVGDRIIDVSRRAAQLLGFDKQGVTKVRIQASDEKGRILARKKKDNNGRERHYVQLGAFGNQKTAKALRSRARKAGAGDVELARVRKGNSVLWRVRMGPFKSLKKAERALDLVITRGFYDARIFTEASG